MNKVRSANQILTKLSINKIGWKIDKNMLMVQANCVVQITSNGLELISIKLVQR